MKTISKFTYSDYLKINDDKQYEIIDGDLKILPSPSFEHQDISMKLSLLFGSFVKKNKIGVVCTTPIDVALNETHLVQPDIVYISNENKEIIDKKRGIKGSPDLVIEIISLSSKYRDTYIKKNLYEQFKIKEYWLIAPFSKSIEVLVLKDNIYELYSEAYIDESEEVNNTIIKSLVLKDFEFDIKEIFNDL